MQLNNFLIQMGIDEVLSHFLVRRNEDGSFVKDPFEWNGLTVAPDQGPDGMCLDGWAAYEKDLNYQSEWDPRHGSNNSSKHALKEEGEWRQVVLWVSSHNAAYGSTLSPSRQQQIQETMNELISIADPPPRGL